MKKLIIAVALFLSVASIAQPPVGYYNSALNQSCANLKTALKNIITSGHTAQSYGDLWTFYLTNEVRPRPIGSMGSANVIWDMYSFKADGTANYYYTPGTGQCGTYNSEGDCYNREHSFPASWFNDEAPSYTDIHHLFATDGYVNNIRSNFRFGEVASATFTSTNGSKRGTSATAGITGTVFEPTNEYKGDFARAYLYMVTRYQDRLSVWDGYSTDGALTLTGNTFPSVDINYLKLMLKWHNQDPVSAKEIARNNAAYTFQGNRNPFVDSAQYVAAVWNASCPGLSALPVNLIFFEGRLTGNFINLNWTVGTENNVKEYVIERSVNGQEFKAIASVLALGKNNYGFKDEVENLSGRRLYYRIRKVDNDGSYKYSEVFTIHVPLNVSFSIYPNPVKGNLIVNFAKDVDKNFAIVITDIAGRIVMQNPQQAATGKQAVLNVSTLKAGTYVLKISTNGIERSQKFVVVN